jgi:hypothetical protein
VRVYEFAGILFIEKAFRQLFQLQVWTTWISGYRYTRLLELSLMGLEVLY